MVWRSSPHFPTVAQCFICIDLCAVTMISKVYVKEIKYDIDEKGEYEILE
jgi:hypothetical protein